MQFEKTRERTIRGLSGEELPEVTKEWKISVLLGV